MTLLYKKWRLKADWSDWADVPDVDVRYVYDGQNLVAELDGKQETPALERAYVWGRSYLPGGGPVGGLLMALLTDSWGDQKVVNYSYDANGNVKELTGEFGDVFGSYDYDPFGKLVQVSGSWAAYNPMRFSTKYAETDGLRSGVPLGLYYYGARFYKPDTGRFLNRDPMEEAGGLNLYAFCHNDGVNLNDPDGMCYDAFEMGGIMAANNYNPTDPLNPTMADAVGVQETLVGQGGLLCPDGTMLTTNNADYFSSMLEGALVGIGSELERTGVLRDQYVSDAAGLSSLDSAGRSALRDVYADKQTALGQAITDDILNSRAASGYQSTLSNAAKTNAAVNEAATAMKWAGRASLVADIALEAHNVATAPSGEKVEAATQAAGRFWGASEGGAAGAQMGAAGGPWGVAIGSGVGGVIGALGGEELVNRVFGWNASTGGFSPGGGAIGGYGASGAW